MTELLEKVHLQPDIADYVKELWMPGPHHSCKPNDGLGAFPTRVIRFIEAEFTRCIQPQYLDYYLKDSWQDSKSALFSSPLQCSSYFPTSRRFVVVEVLIMVEVVNYGAPRHCTN